MKAIFTAFCCLLTFAAAAQKNFVPGYYLTTSGDTVKSYIDDRNWIKSPDHIRVAPSPESSSFTTLSAAQIKGFGLTTGDIFKSEIVQIDKSPENLNQMKVDDVPLIVTDTVLLRVLASGKLTLLYMEDENSKKHFFLQKAGEQPNELIIRKRMVAVDGTKAVSRVNVYQEILKLNMQDCPEALKQIRSTQLQTQPLVKLFTNYNSCFADTEKQYVASTEKVTFKFGVVGGLMPSQLKINRSGTEYDLSSGDLSRNYTAGISMNAVLPRGNGKWSIYNELAWKAYQVKGEQERRIYGEFRHEKLDFDMGYIGLNTMVRYQFSLLSWKPFVSVGMANNYNIVNNNTIETFSRVFTMERTTTAPMLDPIRKYEQGLLIGAGIELRRLRAEARIETSNGMSAFTEVSTARNSFNLLVGYSFN